MCGSRSDGLILAALIASFITLAASMVILMVPIINADRRTDLGQGVALASIGIPGVLAGVCVVLSSFRGSGRVLAVLGVILALAYIALLYPFYLGIGHLYAPTAVALIILAGWNLVRYIRKSQRR